MIRPLDAGRPLAAALAAVLAVAAGALTVGSAAGSAATDSAPRGVARQPSGQIRLELVDQRIAFGADGDIRLVYRIDGDLSGVTALAPPESTTTTAPEPDLPDPDAPPVDELSVIVVNYEPLSPGDDPGRYVGRAALTATVSDPIDGVVLANGRDLLTFAEDGTVTLDVTAGTDSGESVEERLRFDEPGLYPIILSLVVGNGDERQVVASYGTIVQRLPGPADAARSSPPIDLSIAVAIDEIGPEPSAGDLAAARSELDSALALTSAVSSPVTLSIPPLVLGEAAGRDRAALAEALAGDRLLSVPATPLNVSAAAAAGVSGAFARQLREGEDLLTAAAPANVARRDVWIATEPLSSMGAQVVRDLGFRYVVMTPTMFAATVDAELPATDLFVEIVLPDGGTLPLLVVDALGARLTTEATDEILADDSAVEWAVQTIVDMLLDQERDGRLVERSRILSAPDLTAPDPRLIRALEKLVETTPSIRFTEAGNLPGVTDARREGGDDVGVRLPDAVGTDLSARLERLDTAAVAMLSAGSMLPADDPRPTEWATRISELVSTGYRDGDVEATIAALLAEAERLKGSVVPPEPFTFTLTGRSGDIDLRLSNTADEPLTVLVRLSSPKLSFPEGEQLVELRPNEQTLVAVPVRARTNGTSAVRVEILTPAGEAIREPVVLTSRVNALTGFGQVLTGGLVLVLLTWWFSHWRARRRAATASLAGEVMERHPSNGK